MVETSGVSPRDVGRTLVRFCRCVSLVVGGAAAIVVGTAEAKPHVFTLDDYLRLEATGRGAGRGERIVWEQAPPYLDLHYFGHGHLGAWDETGFVLKTIDLAAPKMSSASLFKAKPGSSYWFDSFSPDGRYVAFYAATEGKFTIGAFDTQKNVARSFGKTPVVDWVQGRESVWVSPEEFVFSSHVNGMQPLAAIRPLTGLRLAREWEDAWHGRVSVSVEKTQLDNATAPVWKVGRLYRANARTGVVTMMAEGKFESLKLSADGRYLAGLRQADLMPPSQGKPSVDWVHARSQLTVFDLQVGGPGIPIAANKDVFVETLAWAPDHSRLAFFGWNPGEAVQSGMFWAVDIKTGMTTPYPHMGLDLASERERGFYQKPERVIWVDGRLAIFARRHNGKTPRFSYRDITRPGRGGNPGKADWFLLDADGRSENLTARFEDVSPVPLQADTETLTVLADGDVWRIGPRREPRNLTAGVEPRLVLPLSQRYSTVHRQFGAETILVSEDVQVPGFALIDFETGAAKFVAAPTPDVELLGGSSKAGAVFFRYDHESGSDLLLKRTDGRTTVVDRINRHMEGVLKTEWRTIQYELSSRSGKRAIESCVLLPPNYQVGKRYPTIVEVYPNRGADCLQPSSKKYFALGRDPGPYTEHLLAAKGYVVFQPNTSAQFTRTKGGPLGGLTDVVEQGVKALVDQGYTDTQRIGLVGYSQGGFSSLWLATQSKLFKAVVSLNGWSDMYVHYFDPTYVQDFYSHEFGFEGSARTYESTAGTDFPIGSSPYEDPMAYLRQSPLYNARTITAPILLVHSDMDIFALQQYERFYTALHQLRKPAKLLRYWGEGHGPSSPANIRHMWREIFQWYDQYLSVGSSGAPLAQERPARRP